MLPWTIFLAVVAYLLGAIPFGVLVAKRAADIDLSSHGSGNTGAANAYRALGLKGGLTVLALDALKGTIAVLLAHVALMPALLLPILKSVFGLAAIVGHNFSVFRGFKGGKGIATSFGVIIGISPKVALLAALLWLAVVGLTRYSSVGSLTAMSSLPLLMVVERMSWVYVLFSLLVAALAFYRHRPNLERLRQGTELRFNDKVR